jgi:hypothetical protein
VTSLDRELARALVAALRDDPELRDELRGLLVDTTAEPTPASRKWLTVAEAAERLACTPDAVRMRCSRPARPPPTRTPTVHIGRIRGPARVKGVR